LKHSMLDYSVETSDSCFLDFYMAHHRRDDISKSKIRYPDGYKSIISLCREKFNIDGGMSHICFGKTGDKKHKRSFKYGIFKKRLEMSNVYNSDHIIDVDVKSNHARWGKRFIVIDTLIDTIMKTKDAVYHIGKEAQSLSSEERLKIGEFKETNIVSNRNMFCHIAEALSNRIRLLKKHMWNETGAYRPSVVCSSCKTDFIFPHNRFNKDIDVKVAYAITTPGGYTMTLQRDDTNDFVPVDIEYNGEMLDNLLVISDTELEYPTSESKEGICMRIIPFICNLPPIAILWYLDQTGTSSYTNRVFILKCLDEVIAVKVLAYMITEYLEDMLMEGENYTSLCDYGACDTFFDDDGEVLERFKTKEDIVKELEKLSKENLQKIVAVQNFVFELVNKHIPPDVCIIMPYEFMVSLHLYHYRCKMNDQIVFIYKCLFMWMAESATRWFQIWGCNVFLVQNTKELRLIMDYVVYRTRSHHIKRKHIDSIGFSTKYITFTRKTMNQLIDFESDIALDPSDESEDE